MVNILARHGAANTPDTLPERGVKAPETSRTAIPNWTPEAQARGLRQALEAQPTPQSVNNAMDATQGWRDRAGQQMTNEEQARRGDLRSMLEQRAEDRTHQAGEAARDRESAETIAMMQALAQQGGNQPNVMDLGDGTRVVYDNNNFRVIGDDGQTKGTWRQMENGVWGFVDGQGNPMDIKFQPPQPIDPTQAAAEVQARRKYADLHAELNGLEGQEGGMFSNPEKRRNELRAELDAMEQAYPFLGGKENGTRQGGGEAAGNRSDVPTLTPEQAARADPGTVYRTTDGRLLRR